MKQFLTVIIVAMFGLLSVPATHAGIVDSFESSTNATGFLGAPITRTTAFADGFLPSAGIIFFASGGDFGQVNYSIGSGTFASYGDTFTVGVESDLANYSVLLTNDLGQAKFWSGQTPATTSLALADSGSFSVTGAKELNFTFFFSSPGTFGFGAGGDFVGSFSAVPEPTSLALVGIAFGGLALRRRRS